MKMTIVERNAKESVSKEPKYFYGDAMAVLLLPLSLSGSLNWDNCALKWNIFESQQLNQIYRRFLSTGFMEIFPPSLYVFRAKEIFLYISLE
jgi:hypothetical protein